MSFNIINGQTINSQVSSSSWKSWTYEKFLEVKYPLKDVLQAATWGVFKRLKQFNPLPLLTTRSFDHYLNPQATAIPQIIDKFSAKQITLENIENSQVFLPDVLYKGYNPGNMPSLPSQEKLKYVLSTVDAIAKKMDIQKEVLVFAVNDTSVQTSAIGGTWFKGPIAIRFNVNTVKDADEIIDFITAHELSHCKHNHSYKRLFFDLTILTVDTIAAATIAGVLLIPFIEGAASIAGHAISRVHEKEADIYAMKILGTNKGAIEYLENCIKDNLKTKNCPLMKILAPSSVEQVTDDGSLRSDLDHPSETTRLAYAKQWIPTHKKME